MLCYFGNDARPPGGGVRDVDCAIGKLDDGGGDGGQWAFERLDEVCFGGNVAECVCCVGDAEVWVQVSLFQKSNADMFPYHSFRCS